MTERSNESGVSAELVEQWFIKAEEATNARGGVAFRTELCRLAYAKGLQDAAKVCENIAWTNKATPMLGPELNAVKCAEAIRNLPGAKQ